MNKRLKLQMTQVIPHLETVSKTLQLLMIMKDCKMKGKQNFKQSKEDKLNNF